MTAQPTPESAPDRPSYQVMPDLTDAEFEALKADIRERGVMVPIEFTEDGEVLDGHHRLRACRELGVTSYPRVIRSGLTHDEKTAHALALNVHRRHLTSAQRADAVMRLREQGWSVRRISDATGIPRSTVDRDIRLSGGGSLSTITGVDGRTYKAKKPPRATKPTSVYVHSAHQQIVAQEALQALQGDVPAKTLDLRRLERLRREQRSRDAKAALAALPDAYVPGAPDIRHAAIADLSIAPGTVDLVLTDPPYSGRECFDPDGPWDTLGRKAIDWLKPGGLLLAYTGHIHLARCIQILSRYADDGLAYWWTYAITHPGGGTGKQVRTRGIAVSWRPVLAYRKTGGPQVPRFSADPVIGGGREKDTPHPWQQGVQEARIFIDRLTTRGNLVVDPFVGSGTVAIAAALEGRDCIAADHDLDYVNLTRARLHDLFATDQPRGSQMPSGEDSL